MNIVYQTKSNTNFPYLYCHGCGQSKDAGTVIEGAEYMADVERFWMRLCDDCLTTLCGTFLERITANNPGVEA